MGLLHLRLGCFISKRVCGAGRVALKPSLSWNGDKPVCGSVGRAAGWRLLLSRLKTRRNPADVLQRHCVASPRHVPAVPAHSTSNWTPRPDCFPVSHAASHSPVTFTRGATQTKSKYLTVVLFFRPPPPPRGLFVSFLSECQAFAWVSKQTSSSRNDVSEKCHWSGMSCQSLCWANDYFWVLWELKV